jgi:hypothetical protein
MVMLALELLGRMDSKLRALSECVHPVGCSARMLSNRGFSFVKYSNRRYERLNVVITKNGTNKTDIMTKTVHRKNVNKGRGFPRELTLNILIFQTLQDDFFIACDAYFTLDCFSDG